MEREIIIYNGIKFTRYPNAKGRSERVYFTGRFKGKKTRLHIFKYKNEVGEIPNGFVIHHKDGDSLNNAMQNLELIEKTQHIKLHMECETRKQQSRNNLEKFARPKASEWHSSEEGKKFHSKLSLSRVKIVEIVCKECGKEAKRKLLTRQPMYCSDKCRKRVAARTFRAKSKSL